MYRKSQFIKRNAYAKYFLALIVVDIYGDRIAQWRHPRVSLCRPWLRSRHCIVC